ncbi:MAG: UDPGP type 1 family protein [Clostridia bacterium]|nr:UDPGP type 1 family protein [Clostridia bacterium]
MEEKLKQVKEATEKNGQEHLLNIYNKLPDEEKRQELLDDILTVDFKQVNKLYDISKQPPAFKNSVIEPISYVDKSKLSKTEYEDYENIGIKEIKDGKLAVVTMAGGQGTRLGHSGPKGTFDLGLDTHKSIFEILTDTLIEARKEYGVDIPWYIMTSEENNDETQKFFKDHNFFGYPKDCITFFKQGKLPMLSTDGKLLVNEDGRLKEAADGHGGIFKSLLNDGMIYDMKARNIEWAFIGGVDNVLVKPVDPILLGLSIKKNVLAAVKSIVKAHPHEKVGVFCKRDGKPSVIEYSEISKDMAEELDENGELKYGESNTLCNLFSLKAIEKVSEVNLPYHIAFKKASYIDKNGEIVKPSEPNAYKFEAFLFDAFEILDDIAVLRVKREEEFAPVKNAEGADSPETARKLYLDFHNS